jgi:hypothetical protein
MAVQGTPFTGLDDIATLSYVSGALTLVCYTNTPDSFGPSTVFGDLTQPTQANGYAPIVLDGVWSTANGVVTYLHSTGVNPRWVAQGTWSAPVTGVAITRGTILRHFKDLDSAFTAAANKPLEVDLNSVLG